MASLLRLYKRFVDSYPFLSQSLQAGLLTGTGDLIAQTAIEKTPPIDIDWTRTLQFTSVGLFVVGPTLRLWYGRLDRIVGSPKTKAVKKMALDQLCFAPGFIVVILASIGTVQGRSLQDTGANIKRDYFDILTTNYKIWPAVQICNFYFVPLNYQVLVTQIVAIMWNSYLSWRTNQK